MAEYPYSAATSGNASAQRLTIHNRTEIRNLVDLMVRLDVDDGVRLFGSLSATDVVLEIHALATNMATGRFPDGAMMARSFDALARLAALALIFGDAT
jgi:hypothetical protein